MVYRRSDSNGIELSSTSSSQRQIPDNGHAGRSRQGEEEDEHAALNFFPSSSAQEDPEIPTQPDGDVAEHRALDDRRGGFFSTRYVSLDPTRRLPLLKGNGRWLAIAAIGTLLVFLVISAYLALWQAELPEARLNGGCQYLDYTPPLGIIQPHMYNISLQFSEANFDPNYSAASQEFQGSSAMTFAVLNDTRQILLHSVDLNFTHVLLGQDGMDGICVCGMGCRVPNCSDVIVPVSSEQCSDFEAVNIDIGDQQLAKGEIASLILTYTGKFHPSQGIYRSALRPTNSRASELMLVTQLESRGARRVFPCIDEPAQKAIFNVDITVPSIYKHVLTNTPLIGSEEMSGSMVKHDFKPTPVMSTYLLALAIGNPESFSLDQPYEANKPVSVWSLSSPDERRNPYEESVQALRFYTAWTGISQPMEKFDMVAVPGKGGAMENWGLLLFDEERFSANWELTGLYGAWRMADVICHEVAHQWFGNLVTAAEWKHLTVNEGLASFMEYLCFQGASDGSQATAVGHILSQRSVTPLGQPRGVHEGPREIELRVDGELFNSPLVPGGSDAPPLGEITYCKGAAILQMTYALMEQRQQGSFQAGLRDFLVRHMYGNASVEDILESLAGHYTEAGGKGPNDLAAFSHEPGYPLLTVTAATDSSKFEITQARYVDWDSDEQNQTSKHWTVPVSLGVLNDSRASMQSRKTIWITGTDADLLFETPISSEGTAWILNADGKGLYRTLYPESHLEQLLESLELLDGTGDYSSMLAAEALLSDIFALFFKGLIPAQSAVRAAQAAVKAPAMMTPAGQYLFGGVILDWVDKLTHLLNVNDSCITDLKLFTKNLLQPVAEHIEERLSNKPVAEITPGDDAVLYSLIQDRILSEVSESGANDISARICNSSTMAAYARHRLGASHPAGCNLVLPTDPSRVYGPVEVWMGLIKDWSTQKYSDVLMTRANLFASAYTTEGSLVQMMVNSIVNQDLRPLLLMANVTESAADSKISPGDEGPLLEILSRGKSGAIAVWNSLYNRLQSHSDHDRVWNLMNSVTLLPTQEVLSVVESLVDSVPVELRSYAEKQVLGRLRHHVRWRTTIGEEFCAHLRA